jgi:hypothetical protein
MIGARIGNWYLEAELARGTLGVVYKARAFDETGRSAAVKVFTDLPAADAAFLAKFPAEMLALQRLDHPNVAKYYDSGTHGGLAYIASELVDGTDAARLLEAGRRPWPEVLSVAVQAARALKHGHGRNVLHRDLKPGHLMLAADGTLKVLSFGLARVVPLPPPSAVPVMGSAAYLPPETASGKPPTRRSDFYSLGGVLYTLLTGRPPFVANSAVELVHKQCYALPERPGMLVPGLPPEVDELVCSLLDKNPARRPATAAGLLEELERVRGKLERKGEKLSWPPKLVPDTAEMPALPANLGGAPDDTDEHPVSRPLMRRPAVVLPLFLLVVGAVVAAFAWPRKSADDLWHAAEPLVASENSADWDRAWDDYLEPLTRKYPDRYTAEVADARAWIAERKELRRAVAAGAKVDPKSEAERAYLRGLRLAQAGDADAARRTWQSVLAAFGPVESERRWVDLSRAGLTALAQHPPGERSAPDRAPLAAAVAHARALSAAGKTADAAAVLAALEYLYRDDPAALETIRGNP